MNTVSVTNIPGALRAFDEETSSVPSPIRSWWRKPVVRRIHRRISWVWFAVMAAQTLLGSGKGLYFSTTFYRMALDVIGVIATFFLLLHSAIAIWTSGVWSLRRSLQSWALYAGYAALPCALVAFFLPFTERKALACATWVLATPHILWGAWYGFRRLELQIWQRIPLVSLLTLLLLAIIQAAGTPDKN